MFWDDVIGRDETSGCYHCMDRPEDTVELTVEVYPAWVEHRRVLQEVIGGGETVTSFASITASNASEGGGVEGPGDTSIFCLSTPLPPEFE